jgi:uncharacterized protein YjbI with pentapeptide repeats
LTNAILTRADLSGANLSGANLDHASLSSVGLDRANLTGTTLDGVTRRRSDHPARWLEPQGRASCGPQHELRYWTVGGCAYAEPRPWVPKFPGENLTFLFACHAEGRVLSEQKLRTPQLTIN